MNKTALRRALDREICRQNRRALLGRWLALATCALPWGILIYLILPE